MVDLVPEESMRVACDAYEAAVTAEYDAAEAGVLRDDQPWECHAEIVAVRAAAPLIVAAELDRMADDYAAAGDVFGNRAESLLSERPEGYQAMADRCVGKAIVLDQESLALRRRASVLRGEGASE